MKNKKDDWFVWFILLGILMAVYYQIDMIWIHPNNYSSGSEEDQYYQYQSEAIRGY